MRILIGIILIIIGFLLIWKNEAIVGFAGYSSWAEDKLGTMGGTRMMYKLIGLLFVFGGLLAITNMHEGFIDATLGKLFNPKM